MNLFVLVLLVVMLGLVVYAAVVHARDHRSADRACWAFAVVGVVAAIAALAGSWQELVAMLIAVPVTAVAVMGLILLAIGPDMRRDLRTGWRIDRALAARGRHLVIPTAPDPDHPPTTARTG